MLFATILLLLYCLEEKMHTIICFVSKLVPAASQTRSSPGSHYCFPWLPRSGRAEEQNFSFLCITTKEGHIMPIEGGQAVFFLRMCGSPPPDPRFLRETIMNLVQTNLKCCSLRVGIVDPPTVPDEIIICVVWRPCAIKSATYISACGLQCKGNYYSLYNTECCQVYQL